MHHWRILFSEIQNVLWRKKEKKKPNIYVTCSGKNSCRKGPSNMIPSPSGSNLVFMRFTLKQEHWIQKYELHIFILAWLCYGVLQHFWLPNILRFFLFRLLKWQMHQNGTRFEKMQLFLNQSNLLFKMEVVIILKDCLIR